MLKNIWKALKHPWVVSSFQIIVLLLVVWFLGGLISVAGHPILGSVQDRAIVMFVALAAWGIGHMVGGQSLMAPGTKGAIVPRIVEALRGHDEGPRIAGATASIADTVALLRKTMRRRDAAYVRPWYLLLGDVASGKTAALRTAGLDFPLDGALDPVPPDETSDWACLITEKAVVVDSRGGLDPDGEGKAGWRRLLAQLRRYRPRLPLNGVVLAVDIVTLAAATDSERVRQALRLRSKLLDLSARLGVRVPVYVLFTKMDQILGFTEYFDRLGHRERHDVLGVAFQAGGPYPAEAFAALVEELVGRLRERVTKLMREETSAARRSLIFEFPTQLSLLAEPTGTFLSLVFHTSVFHPPLMLRGAYLTAARADPNAELRSCDLLSAAMPSAPVSALPVIRRSGTAYDGQGLFLHRLFQEVIFTEGALACRDPKIERRRRFRWAMTAAFGLAAAVWLGSQYLAASRFDGRTLAARRTALTELVAVGRSGAAATANLADLVPFLDNLRIWAEADGRLDRAPWMIRFPLTAPMFVSSQLAVDGRKLYARALRLYLAPLLQSRMESAIRGSLGHAGTLFDALRVYLMFGGQGPEQPGLIQRWAGRYVAPELSDPGERHALVVHVGALLQSGQGQRKLDPSLIATARKHLPKAPLAQWAYRALLQSPQVAALKEWTVISAGGDLAQQVLLRSSGKSLWSGVPGLYTRQGYTKVFKPDSLVYARMFARQGWVLGLHDDSVALAKLAKSLHANMVDLYLADYRRNWDYLLADLEIAPFHDLTQAATNLNVLSGPNSPLKRVLISAAHETDLDPPPPPKAVAAVDALVAKASRAAVPSAISPEHQITLHYQALRNFVVGKKGSASGLDGVIKTLGDAYAYINQLSVSQQPSDTMASLAHVVGQGGTAASSPLVKLRLMASNAPQPVAHFMESVAGNGIAVAANDMHGYLSTIWSQTVAQQCHATLDGRYPHDATGRAAISLADFSLLFGPNGGITRFFNTYLKPFVDTSGHPWGWRKSAGDSLGLSNKSLRMFEEAARIRDGFFMPGQPAPHLAFVLTPERLSARIKQVTLSVDGQSLIYHHGPPQPVTVVWPAAKGKDSASLGGAFSPVTLSFNGPWAMFRLFDQGSLSQESDGTYRLTFQLGKGYAAFNLRPTRQDIDWAMFRLRHFTCLDSL